MTDPSINNIPPPQTLENERLRLQFLPACGGKISSLFDKTHSYEWLWSNPHLPLRKPGYEESYEESLDFGGWDEIFPSVNPCRIQADGADLLIPDHGDLVRLPWSIHSDATSVEMTVQGRCCSFQFTRRVELLGSQVVFSYFLENAGDFAFPWLWCAHPLIPFDEGLSVETDTRLFVSDALAAAEPLKGQWLTWDKLPLNSASWAAKLFSGKNHASGIRLRQASGTALAFDWDANEIPYLGLWANHGAWSGRRSSPYFNLGIEPTMLPVDDLGTASDPPTIKPGECREWSLRLRIDT